MDGRLFRKPWGRLLARARLVSGRVVPDGSGVNLVVPGTIPAVVTVEVGKTVVFGGGRVVVVVVPVVAWVDIPIVVAVVAVPVVITGAVVDCVDVFCQCTAGF